MGLKTSPYFDMNNVVCSETVTSSIRTSVWLMSRALNTYMSITDGGPYSLMNVTYFKENYRKPSMSVLSSYYEYRNNRYLTFKPLGGINWKEHFDNNVSPYEDPFTKLDSLAAERGAKNTL
jgi:hypothetical protein